MPASRASTRGFVLAVLILQIPTIVHGQIEENAPTSRVGMAAVAALSSTKTFGVAFDVLSFPLGIGVETTVDGVEGDYRALCTIRKNTVAGPGVSSFLGAGTGISSEQQAGVFLAGEAGLRAAAKQGIGFMLGGRIEYYVQGETAVRPVGTVAIGIWF